MGQVPQNRNFWDTLPYFRGEQPANRPPSAGSVRCDDNSYRIPQTVRHRSP